MKIKESFASWNTNQGFPARCPGIAVREKTAANMLSEDLPL